MPFISADRSVSVSLATGVRFARFACFVLPAFSAQKAIVLTRSFQSDILSDTRDARR
jgi:hypothetical protein